jgi:PAS domain S-box-containing protein
MSAEESGALADENRRLRARVLELEEQIRRGQSRSERDSSQVTNVVRLLKQKDDRLGQMYEELEEKNLQLQQVVEQLKKKNEELSVWISSLRLYQDIFENEPAAMIGLNLEGRILLFNKAAADHFGEAIKGGMMKQIEALDFGRSDPGAPGLARQVLKGGTRETRRLEREGRLVETWAFPVAVGGALKGVLLKIGLPGR